MSTASIPPGGSIHLEGVRKQAIETGRNRLLVTAVVFTFAFVAVTVRLVDLTVMSGGGRLQMARSNAEPAPVVDRADQTRGPPAVDCVGQWRRVTGRPC